MDTLTDAFDQLRVRRDITNFARSRLTASLQLPTGGVFATLRNGVRVVAQPIPVTYQTTIRSDVCRCGSRTYAVRPSRLDVSNRPRERWWGVTDQYPPMSFEEVLQLMKKSNTKIMVDLKLEQPIVWFNKSINEMLKKYDMLNDAVFLRNDVINLYDGGKFGFRMSDLDRIKKMVSAGIDVSNRYYLFDHGNRINAEAARWCQKNNIMVCASVNFGHYSLEDPTKGAKRDIEHLIQCGLTVFQIDSDFDEFFH